jgi:hypothetical protein
VIQPKKQVAEQKKKKTDFRLLSCVACRFGQLLVHLQYDRYCITILATSFGQCHSGSAEHLPERKRETGGNNRARRIELPIF